MESWLKPMLCDQAADVPDDSDLWIIERKLDGWRAIAHRTPNRVRLYGGRNGSEYTGKLPYIEGVLHRLPEDTAVDGELIAPEGWGSVQGTMTRGGTAAHEPSAASPPLLFVLFDVLRVRGQDVRKLEWVERRKMLEAAGFKGPLVFTSQAVPADPRAHEQFLHEGAEGSVAKRIDSKYIAGKSHHQWVKIKPTLTSEARITGFKAGTPGSDFDGTLGALEIEMLDANDQPTGAAAKVGTGFDRDLRNLIWGDQPAWMGRIIEVRYQELSAAGVPRFPRFERTREDKDHAPPTPTPTKPSKPRAAGGARPRNYKAMGDAKLIQCIAELRGGYGESTERAESRHTGTVNELALAEAAAREKGLNP